MTERLEVDKEYWIKGKLVVDDKGSVPFRFEIGGMFFWVGEDIEAVEAIPEREKVTIPKFVAEWIEKCKAEKFTLSYVFSGKPKDVDEWVVADYMIRCDTIARAWLDGYKIKEPLYRVILPDPNRIGQQKIMLKRQADGSVIFSKSKATNHESQLLTEQEIKEDFKWAWQFAEPVEEDDE